MIRHLLDRRSAQGAIALPTGIEQGLAGAKMCRSGTEQITGRWINRDIDNRMGNVLILQPGQRLATGAAPAVAVDPNGIAQRSTTEQGFHRTHKAVGSLTSAIGGLGADGHITIDGGPAAQAVVRRTISEVNLFDVAAW